MDFLVSVFISDNGRKDETEHCISFSKGQVENKMYCRAHTFTHEIENGNKYCTSVKKQVRIAVSISVGKGCVGICIFPL